MQPLTPSSLARRPSRSISRLALTFSISEQRRGKESGLKLFHTTTSGVTEVTSRLAEAEADMQDLVEAHMETMLGARFLASEYVLDCADGGRIDSLGLDENGAPVIVECKRGTDAGRPWPGVGAAREM